MWIDAAISQPEFIENKNYSKNVLAVCQGHLCVMCYSYIYEDGDVDGYYGWANCYGDISGDPFYDDYYEVTHWMPLPELPKLD